MDKLNDWRALATGAAFEETWETWESYKFEPLPVQPTIHHCEERGCRIASEEEKRCPR